MPLPVSTLPGDITVEGVLTGASVVGSDLTATRVVYVGASGLLVDSANMTFDGTTLTAGGFTTTGLITGGTGHFGGVTHYSDFEADGTLEFNGDATVWDDLRVPLTSIKLGGNDPGFAVAFTNGAASRGVFVYFFDKNGDEEVFFAVQMPHGWKAESNITPHIHWFPKSGGALNATVSWGLEYNWTSLGGTIGNTTIVYTNTTVQGDATLVANKHYMSNFAAISGSGVTGVSPMLICRAFRDATGTGLTDDYDDDAGVLEFDFHYEIDTVGSRAIATK